MNSNIHDGISKVGILKDGCSMIILRNNFSTILVGISLLLMGYNFLFFSALNLHIDNSDIYKNIIRFFAIFLLVGALSLNKKVILFEIFLILFFLSSFLINNNEYTLNFSFILFFLLCSRTLAFNKLLDIVFYIYFSLFFIHVVLFNLGMFDNQIFTYEGRTRADYGFTNVNKLGNFYFLFLVLCLTTFLNSKSKYLKCFFCLLGFGFSLYFILESGSRTSLVCAFIAIFIALTSRVEGLNKANKIFINFSILFGCEISFLLASNYGQFLDNYLSYRPSLFQSYILDYFNSIEYLTLGYSSDFVNSIDNSFLVFIGTVFFPVSFVLIIFSFFKIRKTYILPENYALCISVVLSGIFENNLLRPEFLVVLLLFHVLFFSEQK